MLRVAHISLHGDPLEPLGSIEAGGQNVYVRNLAAQTAARGIKADVYSRWNSPAKARVEGFGPGARSIRLRGGPQEFIKKERLIDHLPEMLADFESFTRQQGLHYDLIHTHYYVEGAFGLALRRRLGGRVPLVHTNHSLGRVKYNHELLQGSPNLEDYLERFDIEARLMEEADLLVATSPHEAEDFRYWYNHHNRNVRVVPCGLDPALFRSHGRLAARDALGLPRNRTILLYVGRLDPRKGIETLFFAYRKLLFDLGPRAQDVMLVIVGGGGEGTAADADSRRFRELAASLQLDEIDPRHPRCGHVLFVGSKMQPEVAQYYSAADVTVVPSCYEPFGMVAIETQACGTPAVVSGVGGLRYAVKDGGGGLHAKPYSPAHLSEKMRRLVEDDSLRRECARRGRRRVVDQFSWQAVTEAMVARYREVLHSRIERVASGAVAGVAGARRISTVPLWAAQVVADAPSRRNAHLDPVAARPMKFFPRSPLAPGAGQIKAPGV